MRDGAIEPGSQSTFVVDFASRANRVRARRPRRRHAVDRRAAPVVYIFAASRRFRAREPAFEDSPAKIESFSPRRRERSRLTGARLRRLISAPSDRALLIGALACYALILFNLIYGIATMGYPRATVPVPPARPAADAARAAAHPLDFRVPLGTMVLAGLCRPEVIFDDGPPVALRRTSASPRKQPREALRY